MNAPKPDMQAELDKMEELLRVVELAELRRNNARLFLAYANAAQRPIAVKTMEREQAALDAAMEAARAQKHRLKGMVVR